MEEEEEEERRTWIVPLAVLVVVFGGEGISSPFGVREFEVRVDGLRSSQSQNDGLERHCVCLSFSFLFSCVICGLFFLLYFFFFFFFRAMG